MAILTGLEVVTITVSTDTVLGVNSNWTPPYANIGDSMTIGGFLFNYDIVGVISPTCLKISPQYREGLYTGTNFNIAQDYTINRKFNEVWKGDRDWPFHYRQSERLMDSIFSTTTVIELEQIRINRDISYDHSAGMHMNLIADDDFTFGSLGKFSQWETDGGTVTTIGGASLACAITETATSLASCIYVGEQPVCSGGIGKFLLTGKVRNRYWEFTDLYHPIYMSSDLGMITETMLASGYYRQVVGTVLSKDTILFKPDFCLNTTTVKGFS